MQSFPVNSALNIKPVSLTSYPTCCFFQPKDNKEKHIKFKSSSTQTQQNNHNVQVYKSALYFFLKDKFLLLAAKDSRQLVKQTSKAFHENNTFFKAPSWCSHFDAFYYVQEKYTNAKGFHKILFFSGTAVTGNLFSFNGSITYYKVLYIREKTIKISFA